MTINVFDVYFYILGPEVGDFWVDADDGSWVGVLDSILLHKNLIPAKSNKFSQNKTEPDQTSRRKIKIYLAIVLGMKTLFQ